VIFGRDEADGVAHRVGAARAADAVDVVLGVHRKVIIHHVRDAVHIDPAGCNVSRDQHAHGAGLEILQGAQALVLRTVGVEGSRSDPAGFEAARDSVGAMFHA